MRKIGRKERENGKRKRLVESRQWKKNNKQETEGAGEKYERKIETQTFP